MKRNMNGKERSGELKMTSRRDTLGDVLYGKRMRAAGSVKRRLLAMVLVIAMMLTSVDASIMAAESTETREATESNVRSESSEAVDVTDTIEDTEDTDAVETAEDATTEKEDFAVVSEDVESTEGIENTTEDYVDGQGVVEATSEENADTACDETSEMMLEQELRDIDADNTNEKFIEDTDVERYSDEDNTELSESELCVDESNVESSVIKSDIEEEVTESTVLKSDSGEVITGSCGTNVTFTLDTSTGELVISGTGAMKDATNYYSSMPLYEYREYIKTVIVEEGVTTIGKYTFLDCEHLISITLPNTITKINYGAFRSCTALTSIVLPDSVEEIGDYAFKGDESLVSVTFSSGLTTIGEDAFYQCTSLEEVILPDTVVTVGDGVFQYCSSLSNVQLSDGMTVISSSMFYQCSSLMTITIPDFVTTVESYAFEYSGLTSVTFPASVTTIGSCAFDSTNLTSVSIPGTLTEIGLSAFGDCTSLTSVSIGEGTVKVESYAFSGCTSLTNVSLPDSLVRFGKEVFKDTLFIEAQTSDMIILSNGVLYQCTSTDEVITVPDEVRAIAAGAFTSNTSIKKVILPDTITIIEPETFDGCTSLESVVLPSSLQLIDEEAFYNCTALTDITLPDTLTEIGAYAFYNCTSLAILNIPDSVAVIGNYAFENAPFIENYTDDMVILGTALYKYQGSDSVVVVPDGVTSISSSAFEYQMQIEKVVLPDSLESIGRWAFFCCNSLTSLIIPDSVTEIDYRAIGYYYTNGYSGTRTKQSNMVIYGGEGSAAQSYASETGITFVALENGIATGSCGDDVSWTLDMETGVLTISGSGAMKDYTSMNGQYGSYVNYITSVVVEEGVTHIGNGSLAGLTYLTSVSLPSSLVSIGNYAFRKCDALTSITIPANVTSISNLAFWLCESLEAVYVDEANGYYCSENGIVYNAAKTSLIIYPMNVQSSIYVVPDTVKTISTALQYTNNLECVVIGDAVTVCLNNAFSYSESLKRIVFSGKATKVGTYSVSAYTNLTLYHDVEVLYSGSKSGWDELIAASTDTDYITWVDTDIYAGYTTLQIGRDADSVARGDNMHLTAMLDSSLAVMFQWSSSDESVASVSDEGIVHAVSEGVALITCISADGNYTASFTLTVTGKGSSYVMPDYTQQSLDASLVGEPFFSMQIPYEQENGIYFLNDGTLAFYSLETASYSVVKEFGSCIDAYEKDGCLYILSDTDKCEVFDLAKQKTVSTIELESGYSASAVGVDDLGRVYIGVYATNNSILNRIFLYTADGDLVTTMIFPSKVYGFAGFDNDTGNFYVEAYFDFTFLYSYPGKAVLMANVTDNQMKYVETSCEMSLGGGFYTEEECIEYLCQSSYLFHQDAAELLGNKYLVMRSVTSSAFYVKDISTLDTVFAVSREAVEYELSSTSRDTTSVGVRAVYNELHDSIIMYDNDKVITEYDMASGEAIASFATQYYVYSLSWMGDWLVIVEKEDDAYYLEVVKWGEPESMTLSAEKTSIEVGESVQVSAECDSAYSVYCEWTSSDSSVASVTDTGRVVAWKEGKTTITASILDGKCTASIDITVTASAITTPDESAVRADGTVTNNASDNNYSVYGSPAYSYLVENEDGTFTRVEYISGTGVLVEVYSSDYELQSSKTLTAELSIFGAFYSGEAYNFLVFGQKNTEESDDCEVIRVVKYDKSWHRISQCSIYGANTYIPFDAGSARLTETDGSLYLYTCHEMYLSSDGYHHQANMTFVITEESMEVSQSYYDVMNISYGYISHSFNQFIQTDGTYIYRVDHGDANPRAVSITRCEVGGDITDVSYSYALSINGSYGANATGVSVGGMELSANNVFLAGNSVDQSDEDTYSAYGQRNIFLCITDKNLESTNTVWLTDYTSDDGITPRTPQLVKLNDYQFLVMWEEYNSSTGEVWVRAVTVDEDGTAASEIVTWNARLSDCQPIMSSDGLVRWYATNGSRLVMYAINPYDLDGAQNINGFVTNLSACTITLSKTSYTYDGTAKTPTVSVKDGSDTLTKGTDYTVSYSSNTNVGIATVSVTGIGEYTGTVDKTFTISKASQTISVDASISIGKGKTVSLGASGQGTLTYSSSDISVVTVDSSGNVTGVKKGSAVITITTSGNSNYKAASATVTVTVKNVQTITVSSTKSMSYGDSSKSLGATCLGDATLTYKSSDASIVKVSSSGKVTAVGVGTATITITAAATDDYASATATVKVTVSQKNISDCQMVFSKTGTITASTLYSSVILLDGDTIMDEDADYWVWGASYWYGSDGGVVDVTVYVMGYGNYTGEAEFSLDPITAKTVLKSATKTSSGVKLTWQKETGAVGYQIYRKTGSGSYSLVKTITKNSTTSWTDTSIADYKQYTYYVRAYTVNSSGKVYATKSSTKTVSTYLTTPTIKSASNTSTGVKLTWSAVSGAAKYQVWRKTSSGSWTKLGTTTSTSYTDKTAKSGTTYSYRLRCVKSNGTTATSLYSSTKSIRRLSAGKVSSLTNTSSGITVKWSKVTGASGYYIYRKAGSGSYKKIATVSGASTVSYTNKTTGTYKVANGTTYTYYVIPYYKSSSGTVTKGTYSTTKKTVRMTAVSLSSVKNSSSKKMTVKWAKNSKATGYQIQYSTSSSFTSGSKTKTVTVSGASTVSKTIGSLTKSKKYYVRIRTYKTVSGTKYYSAWSSKKSVTISK